MYIKATKTPKKSAVLLLFSKCIKGVFRVFFVSKSTKNQIKDSPANSKQPAMADDSTSKDNFALYFFACVFMKSKKSAINIRRIIFP